MKRSATGMEKVLLEGLMHAGCQFWGCEGFLSPAPLCICYRCDSIAVFLEDVELPEEFHDLLDERPHND